MFAITRKFALLGAIIFSLSACQTPGAPIGGYKYAPKTKRNAVAIIYENGRETKVGGYTMDAGQLGYNKGISFYSVQGEEICSGTYSKPTRESDGLISMSCFGGRIQGNGKFTQTGQHGRAGYGVAELQTQSGSIRVVYGITDAELQQYTQ